MILYFSSKTYAIKRFIADEFIARRASEEGASLREGFEVDVGKVCGHLNKKTRINIDRQFPGGI